MTIERVGFFMEHGGLAYHPGRETAEVGRIRTALALADGEPFDNTVTHEELIDGRWVTTAIYNGDDPSESVEVE